MKPLPLDVHNLSVAYGANVVLEDVSMSVNHGELVGLIGPNGAGKTTFIRSVLGLIPTLKGSISVGGKTGKAAAQSIGYVPQRHDFSWDFPISVEQVVMHGFNGQLGLLGRVRRDHWSAVYRSLNRVGMSDFATRTIGKLSGGQRQRVLIARALVADPDVLILDEPFTGLDQPTIDMLLVLFRTLVDEGASIVMSTHDIIGAIDVCDRLVMINKQICADGTPQSLMEPKLWMDTYQVSDTSPLLRSIGLATEGR